jgi:aminodeoxychorismate synthase component I
MRELKLPWQNPLNFAQKIADNYRGEDWIFLYSGLNDEVKNSSSYVALFPKEKIIADDFLAAEKILRTDSKKWFGYLSYELARDFEKLPKTKKSFINLPKIYLLNFSLIFEFDHQRKILRAFFDEKEKLYEVLKYKALKPIKNQLKVKNFDSNFSNESYLQAISDIKKMIAKGDFYQTNLTRKFFGEITKKQNQRQNFQTFLNLNKLSAANYSAFLKLDDSYVISSSPELFLSIKKSGKIISRPIKGTSPRDKEKQKDHQNKITLKKSDKERAENLMIVDLMRNDLSRVCKAGSVEVKNLFKITSYQNLHHMSSEIHGKILPNLTALDVIKSCFPAGSMTGTPKIKAMEIAAQKEKLDRGIYSGTIGYFDSGKRLESNLSVVIRTLILRGQKFEFQVGGAITFDSKEKAELAEIFTKARAILQLLGVNLG